MVARRASGPISRRNGNCVACGRCGVTTIAASTPPLGGGPASEPRGALADHLLRAQLGELLGREAELAAQDLVVVLAERWRGAAVPARADAFPAKGEPGVARAPRVHVVELLEEAAVLELRVRHHAVGVHERMRGDARGEERLHGGVARAGGAPAPELRVDAVVRGVAARRCVE